MNIFGILAIGLMAALTLAHHFGGSPEFYEPLRKSTLAPTMIAGFSVIWHMITSLLLMTTIALIIDYRQPNAALFLFVLAFNIVFGSLFIFYSWSDLGSVFKLPQWIAFLSIAILMLLSKVFSA